MIAQGMPACCGIWVLTGFYSVGRYTDPGKENIDNFLRDQINRAKVDMAFLQINIMQDQLPYMKDSLDYFNFKCVGEASHPSHKSRIFVYLKNMQDVRDRGAKKLTTKIGKLFS